MKYFYRFFRISTFSISSEKKLIDSYCVLFLGKTAWVNHPGRFYLTDKIGDIFLDLVNYFELGIAQITPRTIREFEEIPPEKFLTEKNPEVRKLAKEIINENKRKLAGI